MAQAFQQDCKSSFLQRYGGTRDAQPVHKHTLNYQEGCTQPATTACWVPHPLRIRSAKQNAAQCWNWRGSIPD